MEFYRSKTLIVIRLRKSCTPAGGSRGAGGGEKRRQVDGQETGKPDLMQIFP